MTRHFTLLMSLVLLAGNSIVGAGTKQISSSPQARSIIEASGIQGGLVVYVGDDPNFAVNLRVNDSFIVQELLTDKGRLEAVRESLKSTGLYGKVTARYCGGAYLPYGNNMVNLLLVDSSIPASERELMRVLVPGGLLYTKHENKWEETVKAHDDRLDEFTHYLYDSSNNRVSHDELVGPPKHYTWIAGPKWQRSHEHTRTLCGLVSSGGRLFYFMDDGPIASIQMPSRWKLVCRDAFNGVLLWEKSVEKWFPRHFPAKSGPSQMHRRIVAVEDVVYATLNIDAGISAIDAATGTIIREFEKTAMTEEILVRDGVVYALVNAPEKALLRYVPGKSFVWDDRDYARERYSWKAGGQPRKIVAMEAKTGRTLWSRKDIVAPLTLAVNDKALFYQDDSRLVCLNKRTGEQVWRAESEDISSLPMSYGPTLVLHKDVVLYSGSDKQITAYSSDNGKILWKRRQVHSGHYIQHDLLVIDDLAYIFAAVDQERGLIEGINIYTGEPEFSKMEKQTDWGHARCYRGMGTDNYLMPACMGLSFMETGKSDPALQRSYWIRGTCSLGFIAANGLCYMPPHPCACYTEQKLNYFNAVTATDQGTELNTIDDALRLEKGPLYKRYGNLPVAETTEKDSWPCYRHDAARSGYNAATDVGAEIVRTWETKVPGKLTAPVIADKKVFLASVDTHTLYALDAGSGTIAWDFTADARVDSPPTYAGKRVFFGSADGSVYCLESGSGELVWRYHLAAEDRMMVVEDQLESVWPAHGSILLLGNTLYCMAGRSAMVDGGVAFVKLDAASGKVLSKTNFSAPHDITLDNAREGIEAPKGTIFSEPDILVSDNSSIYMRGLAFDPNTLDAGLHRAHLFSNGGFLDDTWFERTYWRFGTINNSNWGGWYRAAWHHPSGRILVFDDTNVYGFGRRPEFFCNASEKEHQVFSAEKGTKPEEELTATKTEATWLGADWRERRADLPLKKLTAVKYNWRQADPSLLARAMVMTGQKNKRLFIAGPEDLLDEDASNLAPNDSRVLADQQKQFEAWEGERGALLCVYDAEQGEMISQSKQPDMPVMDGLAAAYGRLFMTTTSGKVLCFQTAGSNQ